MKSRSLPIERHPAGQLPRFVLGEPARPNKPCCSNSTPSLFGSVTDGYPWFEVVPRVRYIGSIIIGLTPRRHGLPRPLRPALAGIARVILRHNPCPNQLQKGLRGGRDATLGALASENPGLLKGENLDCLGALTGPRTWAAAELGGGVGPVLEKVFLPGEMGNGTVGRSQPSTRGPTRTHQGPDPRCGLTTSPVAVFLIFPCSCCRRSPYAASFVRIAGIGATLNRQCSMSKHASCQALISTRTN